MMFKRDKYGVASGESRRNKWNLSIIESARELLHEKLKNVAVFKQGFLMNTRGRAIYYQEYTPKCRINGVIFFCHGFGDHTQWLKSNMITALVEAGYMFITFDQEGHGLSDGLHVHIEDKEHLIDTAMFVASNLLSEIPKDIPKFIWGESMGGAVALEVQFRMKAEWEGAILIAPMVKIVESMKPSKFIEYLLRTIAPLVPTWPIVPSPDLSECCLKLEEKRKEAQANPLKQAFTYPRIQSCVEILDLSLIIESKMSEVEIPFLVCHGLADVVTDPKVSQDLFEVSNSHDKTIKLYEDVWHSMFEEPEPHRKKILNDVLGWLNARSGSGI